MITNSDDYKYLIKLNCSISINSLNICIIKNKLNIETKECKKIKIKMHIIEVITKALSMTSIFSGY